MSRKRLFVVLLAIVMSLSFFYAASATQTKDFSTSNEFYGLMVDVPKHEVFKLHENITFNVHVFNALTGVPMSNLTNTSYNLSCVIHFYNTTGDKIRQDIMLYDNDFDFYDVITDTNIIDVAGRHTYRVWCGVWDPNAQPPDLMVGGWVSAFFDITQNGLPFAGDGVIVFFVIAFIAIVCMMIIALFNVLVKFAKLEVKAMDIAYSLMTYIALLSLWAFNMSYMADVNIDAIATLFVEAGILTNIILPLIVFFLVIYSDMMVARKKRRHGEI